MTRPFTLAVVRVSSFAFAVVAVITLVFAAPAGAQNATRGQTL